MDEDRSGISQRFPRKIRVEGVVSSRYSNHRRPLSWDERVGGIDVIKGKDGEKVKLLSEGGQSPPAPGWTIMLLGGDKEAGYKWTLYSLPRRS